MSVASPAATRCPSCGTAASGRFCADCGAAVDGATCAGCRAALSPGAKFCHRCGTAAGAAPAVAAGGSSALPWAFAAIALLAFAAYVAAQRFGAVPIPTQTAQSAPAAGAPPGGAPFAGGAGGPAGTDAPVRGPDISSMSPEERADRLYNRLMTLYEQGKADSVQFFAPMALTAYQMIPNLDPLRRYDLGRIGEVTGAYVLARAQADTLLQQNPDHLLGLVLAAAVAEKEGRTADQARFQRRLVEVAPAELERNPVEYQAHSNLINIALVEARQRQD